MVNIINTCFVYDKEIKVSYSSESWIHVTEYRMCLQTKKY